MTPAETETFIRLWEEGASYQELAAALDCPLATVASRSATVVAQGKIQPRPRGAVQSRRPCTVQNSAVHTPMHSADQEQNSAEPPIPAALAVEFGRLWAAIDALRRDVHRPVQDTVQSLPEPLFDDPADNTTERWNLYLKRGLRVRIEALAKARGVAPSRVVQEILW